MALMAPTPGHFSLYQRLSSHDIELSAPLMSSAVRMGGLGGEAGQSR